MIGHLGVARALGAMLAEKLPDIVALVNDRPGATAIVEPKAIVVDSVSRQLDKLPCIEVIPQTSKITHDIGYKDDKRAYRIQYVVRIEITSIGQSSEEVSQQRLDLCLAVREALITWPDLDEWAGDQTAQLLIPGQTEAAGPPTQGKTHWKGSATITATISVEETLEAPETTVRPPYLLVFAVELLD